MSESKIPSWKMWLKQRHPNCYAVAFKVYRRQSRSLPLPFSKNGKINKNFRAHTNDNTIITSVYLNFLYYISIHIEHGKKI